MPGILRAAALLAVCWLFGFVAHGAAPQGNEGFLFFPLGMVPIAVRQTHGLARRLTEMASFAMVAATLAAYYCSPTAALLYAGATILGSHLALRVLCDNTSPFPLRTENDWMRLVLASVIASLSLTGAAAIATQADGSTQASAVVAAAFLNGFASFLVWLPLATRNRVHPALAGARERIAQWALVLTVTPLVFSHEGPPYVYVVLGLLTWGGLRLTLAETLAQLVVVRMISTTHTAAGWGPYATASTGLSLPPDLEYVHVQLFLVMCSLIVVALSLNSSRTRVEAQIEAVVEATEVAQEQINTVQEELADLREIDRIKDQVLSTVSHELRTPITNVIGYVEMLEDGDYGPLSAPQSAAVGKIDGNSRRLLSLIDDLLLSSRVRAGALDLGASDVDLRHVVKVAVDLLSARADAASLTVVVEEPHQDADIVVAGDPEKLERVLVNLLSNAVKFTPPGGTVTVSLGVERGEAILAVADTGHGISADDLPHLFSQFFRARGALERHIQGTGLGLSIVRSIVEAHGGTIEVSSTVDVGTTFVVRLPLVGAETPDADQIT